MEAFCALFFGIGLLCMIYAMAAAHKVKRQISEILDALSDIKNGNGNRRILAKPHDSVAPLAYEINDIVLAYENRLAAYRRTEEADRRLMTSLSHDVRTPLTTLLGYLDAVQKGIVTGRERDEYVETARRKAHDLKDYIDVLFDWFRLNSNEFALHMDSVEITELTRNILIDWIPILEDRQMEYIVSIPEKPLYARLDPDGYRRIMDNLMQNVIAHSRAEKAKIALCEDGNDIRLTVSDDGIGIQAGDLEHIFERLYKCDKGRSDKGSGLGLSIAHQLAGKMGGEIKAESEPGNGSAFTLSFALARKEEGSC